MKQAARKEAGFSLLEVIIASVILVFVVAITMAILFTATTAVDEGSRASGLQHRGRSLTEFCRDQFDVSLFRDRGNRNILGIYDNNTSIRYQIPVNRDATGAIQWGYTTKMGVNDPGGVGKVCVLRFEADTIFLESTSTIPSSVSQATASSFPALPSLPALTMISSSKGGSLNTVNKDIDGNGNKTEAFVRGKIKKYVVASAINADGTLNNAATLESKETLDDYVVLRVDPSTLQFNGRISFPTGPGTSNPLETTGPFAGKYCGDYLFRYVDGNGTTDGTTGNGSPSTNNYPITSIDTSGLPVTIGVVVTVWHGDWDQNRKGFLIWRDRETIRFRNSQVSQ